MKNEAIYWIALAHLPNWGYGKINNLIVRFFHNDHLSIEEFFGLQPSVWATNYQLRPDDVADLVNARDQLPNNAFFAESLLSQGYELIPVTSPEYPKLLKNNLKISHSPALLYVKGNKRLLTESAIAIVGSRSAEGRSLEFTDNITRLASADSKVVVSGFAKGVDRQALDSAIKYNGKSVIVLPQGITTFSSGFKAYYKPIVNGDVLVLSTFPANAPWSVGLAMARNPIIYGLAEEIFVAQSNEGGGTWSGVVDGFKKGRTIFVREPGENEDSANTLLIRMGGVAVDLNGKVITRKQYSDEMAQPMLVEEPTEEDIQALILKVFNGRPLSATEILEKTKLDWTSQQLATYLKKIAAIGVIKKGQHIQYILKGVQPEQQTLFL